MASRFWQGPRRGVADALPGPPTRSDPRSLPCIREMGRGS